MIYILDTSIILYDPDCFQYFKNAKVIIPMNVLDDLKRFNKDWSELGNNSRIFKRKLNLLRCKGKLTKGVKIEHNISIQILENNQQHWDIIEFTKKIQEKNKQTYLVTKDISLKIKADLHKIKTHSYDEKISLLNDAESIRIHHINQKEYETFKELKCLELKKNIDTFPNQFFILKDKKEEILDFARVSVHQKASCKST